MNRETFLRELKHLLQDVAEDEREEALQYYRDYLEDAGQENEETVLQELGDPARVAAMIRSGLNGTDMGEFSERGYEDPRYRGPSYEVVKAKAKAKRRERDRSNEQSAEDTRQRTSEEKDPYAKKDPYAEKEPMRRYDRNPGMIILIILGAIICAPVVIGLGGGAFGIFAGLAAVVFALFLAIGVAAAGFLVGGIAAFIIGIVRLFLSPLDGILACGTGVGLIGASLLLFALAAVFYGRFLPWIIRGVLNAVRSIFQGFRRGGRAA